MRDGTQYGWLQRKEHAPVRRSFKFRIYPTTGQTSRLGLCLRDHQRLYNAALEERREAWRRSRVRVSYGMQSVQLKEIRGFDPDQGRWSFSSQQSTLRRLNKAFVGFFRRVRAGQKAGYPRFKSLDRWDSVEWPKDGDGCRWHPETSRVYLRGIGHVKVHQHRPTEGRVKTITVKREGRRWYVVFSCDDVPVKPLEPAGRMIGLDVGIARFATASDGEIIANPRFLHASADKLHAAQQAAARKRPGSANARRARLKVAEVHRRIRNRRADFHHKTARDLIKSCDVIAVENLNIAGMSKRPARRPDTGQPDRFIPNGAVAKSGLNKSILDAGWGQFLGILACKAEEAGRRIVSVDPRNTSITCHQCGAKCTRPRQDTVICPRHGPIDADINGAMNIYTRAGLGPGQTAPAA